MRNEEQEISPRVFVSVQPCHLGNPLLTQLTRCGAPVSSIMAERHMPVTAKELMKINFQRFFCTSRRMAELMKYFCNIL